MIHTKEQIIEKAIRVMHDIDWGYDINKKLNPVLFSKEKEESNIRKYIKDEKLKQQYLLELETYRDFWSIGFDFEPEAELETNSMFLHIYDNTGEPFFIRHRQAGFKILKDEKGNYYTENNWTW